MFFSRNLILFLTQSVYYSKASNFAKHLYCLTWILSLKKNNTPKKIADMKEQTKRLLTMKNITITLCVYCTQ